MSISDDLEEEVSNIFKENWTTRDGRVVPDDDSLGLNNDAVKIDATVLYADMHDSTGLVDRNKSHFSAEVYKSFLVCAARIIRSEGGEITAYDGDRAMAVYLGNSQNSSAVRSGLRINWVVRNIINPQIVAQYPNCTHKVRHVVGIDRSSTFVAKTGIRNYNDLVWVGRAANYAAKLSNLSDSYRTYITDTIYNRISDDAKFASGTDMWTALTWKQMNDMRIYGSTYSWKPL